MKKKKYLHTNFIKFLLERYKDTPEPDEEIEIPLPDEDEERPQFNKKKPFKPIEINGEEEEDEETGDEDEEEDDQIIEKLLLEYQKLKRQYESVRIHNRRK